MYERSLANDKITATILGALGVIFRQTSIVWVVFCAGLAALEVLERDYDGKEKGTHRGKAGEDEVSHCWERIFGAHTASL